ncbi:MAG: hypothetical protein GX633_05975 [Clostridiales bacterium]|nr:hypothetical protein [Clostridiales bacterium]
MEKSRKIAIPAIIGALELVLLYISGFMPTMRLALVAIAGLLNATIVIECGAKSALVGYVAVSILSSILSPDKGNTILYALFLGLYPIIKCYIERIRRLALEWILKILLFNIVLAIVYYTFAALFTEVLTFKGLAIWLVVPLANIVFIIYDIGLTKLITYYNRRLRGRIFRIR